MMTRYLGMAAIAVLLGVGGIGVDVSAQPYPDVERQQEQRENNVEQQQDRKAQHRADQEQQREQHERKTERHEDKVRHQNEGSTEHAK